MSARATVGIPMRTRSLRTTCRKGSSVLGPDHKERVFAGHSYTARKADGYFVSAASLSSDDYAAVSSLTVASIRSWVGDDVVRFTITDGLVAIELRAVF